MRCPFTVNVNLLPMFMFEETSHATGVMASSDFDEEEVLTTQNTRELLKLIKPEINRVNTVVTFAEFPP